MSIAAVPDYLDKDFSGASPGMRFGMYLAAWEGTGWAKVKNQPLAGAKRLTNNDQKTMQALRSRQDQLFGTIPAAEGLCLDAKATAPFTTGLGNEHPLENGFAFLNPYGLPYLPGSGVKGVLRQAARELASGDWGDAPGWRGDDEKPFSVVIQNKTVALSVCDVLLGRESRDGDSDHVRGVLSFWDVIPQIQGDHLHVEIMTPHQGHYYQQKQDRKTGDIVSPHESGQPIPIPFLTVPPGSGFAFHVVCDLPRLHRLAPTLAQNDEWKHLLTAAFEHAFEWLGFGAKTAVGYGAMARDQKAEGARQAALEASERAAARAVMSEQQQTIDDFKHAFAKARACGAHQPGSEFDAQRRAFLQTALAWTDPVERRAAAALLRETIVWSGWPSKKERKQEFRDWLAKLEGEGA